MQRTSEKLNDMAFDVISTISNDQNIQRTRLNLQSFCATPKRSDLIKFTFCLTRSGQFLEVNLRID